MIQMLQFEMSFLKGKRFFLPFFSLMLIISLLSLLTLLTSNTNDIYQLAQKASSSMLSSGLIALFYTTWILQHYIHLYRSGYFKMLVAFGYNRHQLFTYQLVQTTIYVIIFLIVMLLATSLTAIFKGIMPWQIITSTSYTSVVLYFLLLLILGQLAALLSSSRKNHMLLIPVLFYWFFESWIQYLLSKQSPDLIHFLPLDSLKQMIGNQVLTISQSIIICLYAGLIIHLLYYSLQKQNLS